MNYALHTETRLVVAAPPADVFALLDDQEALGAHMTKRSAMMAGGQMHYQFDDARGRALGSAIRMSGEMLGLALQVEEVVTERDPPKRKVLETRGPQRMLVIDAYRLGFEIESAGAHSALRVFIDYNLPRGLHSFLAHLPARFYARWCVSRMADAAAERFGTVSST